ncbi:MAG: hypothetical protein OET79_10195 [Nitrospirota bacterium]|nr:hypothetical protein [Nitrospirota bacterium]
MAGRKSFVGRRTGGWKSVGQQCSPAVGRHLGGRADGVTSQASNRCQRALANQSKDTSFINLSPKG